MKVKNIKHGLYEVYWKSGGSSIAAIGYDSHGYNWLSPCNWISGASTDFSGVSHLKLIIQNDYGKKTKSIKSEHPKMVFNSENFNIVEVKQVFEYRENGDANSYTIFKYGNWIMNIQVNGELRTLEQIEIIQEMVKTLNKK